MSPDREHGYPKEWLIGIFRKPKRPSLQPPKSNGFVCSATGCDPKTGDVTLTVRQLNAHPSIAEKFARWVTNRQVVTVQEVDDGK